MDKIKKCPWCSSRIHIDAKICSFCNKKVGKVGPGGIAKMPFNWKAYLISIGVWVIFVLYMWWVFFR